MNSFFLSETSGEKILFVSIFDSRIVQSTQNQVIYNSNGRKKLNIGNEKYYAVIAGKIVPCIKQS